MAQYLLIGNGIAANSAGARIRDREPDAKITIVSDEPEPYFSRCALMYYAMDHCKKWDIYLHQGKHHDDLGAQLIYDTVVSVDSSASTVQLQDRGALGYDKLLIASGGIGRNLGVPGEDAAGVTNFNTLPDAEVVMARMGRPSTASSSAAG